MARNCPSSSSTVFSPRSGKRSGKQAEKKSVTFDSFASSVYLPRTRQRKRSWQVDERIIRQHISASFGARRFATIRRSHVETWLQGLAEKGLAPATCNRVFSVFRSIISLALLHGLVPSGLSPCAGISPFKVYTVRECHLTDAQTQRLLHELDRSPCLQARALKLLMLTGARKCEILHARWENVHFAQRLLIVPIGKSNRPRHIVLSNAALALIRSLPRRNGSPWLFPGHAPGKPLSDLYRFWDRLRRDLDLQDVRIHDLRHTFASVLVNAGHSLYVVQTLLGHSEPRTTMRYAHLGQASLSAAVQDVSAHYAGLDRQLGLVKKKSKKRAVRKRLK